MKPTHGRDLWLSLALGALFVAALLGWGLAVARERAELVRTAQEQLELVARQARDDARCVELFAERDLPGGSEFFLIAPPEEGGKEADTLARYRVHTAGPDTLLERSRFPIEIAAAMRVHVRLDFLLPPVDGDGPDPLADTKTGVFAGESMLTAEVGGRRMEVVDTLDLTQRLQAVFADEAHAGWSACILDTLTGETLYRSPGPVPTRKAPQVRTTSIVRPAIAPWVLVLSLPGATDSAVRTMLPFFLVFLALYGALVFALLRSRQAWVRERRLALMQLDLVSNITHEFNTPLTHIGLALETLKRPDEQARHGRMMDVIGEENARMQANVKKVMAVSLLDREGLPLEQELHDVHELLQRTVNALAPAMEREAVSLTTSFEATDPWVLVDETYLTDVFHSLLDNAIKYGRAPKQVELRTTDVPGGLKVTLADNGPGVPAGERQLVLEKFYRGTNARELGVKGTGIGLYFARKVVEAHGGSLTLGTSALGGLQVELMLPGTADG